MIYIGEIIKLRIAIGDAYGNIIIVVVVCVIYRQNVGAGKAVNGCNHRRLYQSAVCQGKKVIMVVNNIELPACSNIWAICRHSHTLASMPGVSS